MTKIIDYVIIEQKTNIRPMDVRVMPRAKFRSYHFLLLSASCLNYEREFQNKIEKTYTTRQNWKTPRHINIVFVHD